MGKLSPLGLVLNGYGSFDKTSTSVVIVGAQSNAEAALVSASVVTDVLAQFGPLGLSTMARQFSSKETEADVFVSITGAQIQGQVGHPDSAHVTVYPSAAAIVGFANLIASATLIDSLADGALESEVVRGLESARILLTSATWATGQDFNDARQAIIDGFTSTGTESAGWNAEVRDKLSVSAVTRVSDTQVWVSFSGFRLLSVSSKLTTGNSGGNASVTNRSAALPMEFASPASLASWPPCPTPITVPATRAAKMPMMAITASNSMRVNPLSSIALMGVNPLCAMTLGCFILSTS